MLKRRSRDDDGGRVSRVLPNVPRANRAPNASPEGDVVLFCIDSGLKQFHGTRRKRGAWRAPQPAYGRCRRCGWCDVGAVDLGRREDRGRAVSLEQVRYALYPSVSLCIPLYPSVSLYTPLYPSIPLYIPLYPSIPLYTPLYPSLLGSLTRASAVRTPQRLCQVRAARAAPGEV